MGRVDEFNRNHTKEEMYEMGIEFRDGTSATVKMPTTAIKYLTKAAERGHVQAQYELAFMYENGIGSEIDIKKAIDWYTAAASHGYAEAIKALAGK